jgi:regulator of replication initiation timing
MSCLVPLMEEQIELLRKQVKNAALSHDALFAEIGALKAENSALREKLEPQPPMMTGSEPVGTTSGED